MKHRTKRPYRAALALLAGALAVFVGLGAFREAAWPRGQVTLTVEQGDAAALQGFTVRGRLEQNPGTRGRYGFPRLTFTLRDGALTTDAGVAYAADDGVYASWSEPFAVPAADHGRVDAAAVEIDTSSTQGAFFLHRTWYGHLYDAETSRLQLMGIVSFARADRDLGSVALDLGTLTLETPVTVRAERYEDGAPRWMAVQDYQLGLSTEYERLQKTCLTDAQGNMRYGVQPLQDASVPLLVVSPLPGAALQHGVYRATGLLSDAEVAALPADTTVAGQPMRSLASPYGSVELVFPLDEGETVVGDLHPLADGATAVLTRKADGTLRLRVLDENCQLCGTADLPVSLPQGEPTMLQPLRADELAFTVPQAGDDAELWVLRVQGGQLVKSGHLALTAPDQPAAGWQAAGLDESGERLLVGAAAWHEVRAVKPPSYAKPGDDGTGWVRDGFRLRVYDLATGACRVQALLDTHEQASWRGQAWDLGGELAAVLTGPDPDE